MSRTPKLIIPTAKLVSAPKNSDAVSGFALSQREAIPTSEYHRLKNLSPSGSDRTSATNFVSSGDALSFRQTRAKGSGSFRSATGSKTTLSGHLQRVALVTNATPIRCISESFLSLVSGLQTALQELGGCPECLGTDNTSAATHDRACTGSCPRCRCRSAASALADSYRRAGSAARHSVGDCSLHRHLVADGHGPGDRIHCDHDV